MEGENEFIPETQKSEEKTKKIKVKVICSWCGKDMGEKEVESAHEGVTHGICSECAKKGLVREDIKGRKSGGKCASCGIDLGDIGEGQGGKYALCKRCTMKEEEEMAKRREILEKINDKVIG